MRSGENQFGAWVGLAAIADSADLHAIVGAPLAANGSRREAGLAQIHRGRGAAWSEGLVLQPGDEREAHAGWDVALAAGLAAIGIPDLDRGGVDRGGVAVHVAAGEGWSLPSVLDADVEAAEDAPVIESVAALVFDEGTDASPGIRLEDPDTPRDALAMVVQSTDPSVLEDARIAVREAVGGRRVDLDPDPDAHGEFAQQSIAEGLLQETADPAGVVHGAEVIPSADGRSAHLSLSLSGRAGTASFDLRIRDSGGSANGGSDLSAVQEFTVTVASDPGAVFFDGFE